MKLLVLIRHAKSDWGNAGLDDFDRPLNDRGKRDAPVMANRLLQKKLTIDLLVASPAKRAAKTAKIFADIFEVKKEAILFDQQLYLAQPVNFLAVIEKMDNDKNGIAVFSHNYGLTDFANQLTDIRIDNIPTCGIFAVKADCTSWLDFKNAQKEFLFFDYPKKGE